jgi:hypothetical protein
MEYNSVRKTERRGRQAPGAAGMAARLTRPAACLLLLLSALGLEAAEPRAALSTRLEELKVLENRLLLDLGDTRWMYVEHRKAVWPDLEPVQRVFGFSCPWLTVGPASMAGLLRMLYNPLGCGPGSYVFRERTDISLDAGLEPAGRRTVALSLVPEHLELFFLHREEAGAQAGGTLRLERADRLRLELLGLLSGPPAELEEETSGAGEPWFADTAPFPGGLLGHLGGSLAFALERLSLHLAAAASGGERVSPGLLGSLRLACRSSGAELACLLAACSEGYFTPEGRPGELRYKMGLRLDWQPRSACDLYGELGREIARAPLEPGAFLDSRDRLAAGGKARLDLGPARALLLRAEVEGLTGWACGGRLSSENCLEFRSALEIERVEVGIGTEARWRRQSGWEGCLDLDCAWKPARARIGLEAGFAFAPQPGWGASVDLEIGGRDRRIYLQLETAEILPFERIDHAWLEDGPLELFSLCLGWTAEVRPAANAALSDDSQQQPGRLEVDGQT